ncbi:MAG: hypothetical protein L0271_01130 [Gemmatimonadetes bacterium]|nr:hypothetical protein [Gemmatimonadota bacterium]
MTRSFLAVLTPILGATLIAAETDRPAYRTLDANAEPLKSAFNADAGKVRIFMYVSPTCGGCLRGAAEIQKRVLEDVDATNLAVYVVWAPKNGARERHVEKATGLVTDARATQYWDGSGAIVRPFDTLLELTGPCAGAFLMYAPGARWEGSDPPQPAYWEDAHVGDLHRDVAPELDMRTFKDRLVALIH